MECACKQIMGKFGAMNNDDEQCQLTLYTNSAQDGNWRTLFK